VKRRFLVALVPVAVIVIALAYWVQIATPPTPTLTPEVTPAPIPAPPGPELNARADFASSKGFNVAWMESQGSVFPFLVLPPGGSGSIPITLLSTGNEDYNVFLAVSLAGENPKFEGVTCNLSKSTIEIKAGAEVNSILSIEVDLDAPAALYTPSVDAHVAGYTAMPTFPFLLLIYPYTPSYAFQIYAPTPGAPEPLPTPGAPPPTPIIPIIPNISVKPGETLHIMFYTDKMTDDPAVLVNLNLTYDSGPLPQGMGAEVIYNPLKVTPVPTHDSLIMLTLTAAADVPEGTYRMIATISVGSYTTERSFDLSLRR